VCVHWYHGRTCPKPVLDLKAPNWSAGVLFVGTDGILLADYNRRKLLPAERFTDFKPPEPTIPSSIGHRKEWLEACKTGSPTNNCPFSYSGPLTETVLLGNIAYRTGKELHWDPDKMTFTNHPEANKYLKTPYREGWTL
ncbi:MAG: gfo/Idh/MocA family oxidoreductase, partial [Pirellulales bacterium]|nr:gfo/Idh/MocA family oxidoreductase [Pirellulales bacterium]